MHQVIGVRETKQSWWRLFTSSYYSFSLDDDKGFDVSAHKDGYGLNNLDARTKLMQGTMTFDSLVGKGTSVLIEIPYNFNGASA